MVSPHLDRHYYVQGYTINVCLWCGRGPENGIHLRNDEADAQLDGIEADWDASEGRP